MTRCAVCHEPLQVVRVGGTDLLRWAHGPGGQVALREHFVEPEGEGVVHLAAANRSIKLATDAVQRGGDSHQIAETLRLCVFQIQSFRDWAEANPNQLLGGAPEVDPEFDASRAYIPDSPEGL